MSMLAEPRRKRKWVINTTKIPLWTMDSDGIKFGRELMEKMGWSAGKGLGSNEQGIREPLRISSKNDTKGMGFKENDNEWIEQQDEFNVLLNQLRSSDDSFVVKISEEKNEIKSLEEKSKQSKARVHYQKFTRGKDLSRYSENDLACILGTNKAKKQKLQIDEVSENNVKTDGNLEVSFGVKTVNGGSIQDYFKRKWTVGKVQTNTASDADKEYSCEDAKPNVSMESLMSESKDMTKKRKHESEDESISLNGSKSFEFEGNCEKRKKKKKKSELHTSVEEEPKIKRRKNCDPADPGECESLLLEDKGSDSLKKRKKEKKHSKLNEEETLDDKVGSCFSEESAKENCNDIDGGGDPVEVKKKKKKKEKKEKKEIEDGCSSAQELPSVDCVSDCFLKVDCLEKEEESSIKKRKKVKNQCEIFHDLTKENIEEPSLEIDGGITNGLVEEEIAVVDKTKKKKKKSKDYNEHPAVQEAIPQDDNLKNPNDTQEGDEVERSKTKKKKKEKQEGNKGVEDCGPQNKVSCDIAEENPGGNHTEELAEGKKKKKKDKHKTKENKGNEVEESCLEEISKECSFADSKSQSASRKKKKEEQEGNEGLEVCSFQNKASCDIPEENPGCNHTEELVEVKKKKKKDKHKTKENKGNEVEESCLEEISKEGSFADSESQSALKKKKKEEQEGNKGLEVCGFQNMVSYDISEENPGGNHTEELVEGEKKKKRDKHKTKENKGNEVEESCLEEISREHSCADKESESSWKKKKKKKDKKEKPENKVESVVDKSEGSRAEDEETEKDNRKKKKKKEKALENDENREGSGKDDVKGESKAGSDSGNAEIGDSGVDWVKLSSERSSLGHKPGQNTYNRVSQLIRWADITNFRGSNLGAVDGYGSNYTKRDRTNR